MPASTNAIVADISHQESDRDIHTAIMNWVPSCILVVGDVRAAFYVPPVAASMTPCLVF
jgi:hypothetical protein